MSALYHTLSTLRGEFVYLYQAITRNIYGGKLHSLDTQQITLEFYSPEGSPEGFVTVALDSITEIQYGNKKLQEMKHKAWCYQEAKKQVNSVFKPEETINAWG